MSIDEQKSDSTELVRLAWVIALCGFVPFAGLAIAMLLLGTGHGLFLSLLDVFKTYSAIILSFLGGIRWGLAMAKNPAPVWDIALCIIAPVTGWMALFLPDSYSILVLLLAYCAMGAWDSFSVNSGLAPAWFGKLRIVLTFLVSTTHVVVFFALF